MTYLRGNGRASAHETFNQGVPGSSPGRLTKYKRCPELALGVPEQRDARGAADVGQELKTLGVQPAMPQQEIHDGRAA